MLVIVKSRWRWPQSSRNMLVRIQWIKYIINLEVHFVGYLYIMDHVFYFIFFVLPFTWHFLQLVLPHPQYACLPFFICNCYLRPICPNTSVCTLWFDYICTPSFSHTVCVCVPFSCCFDASTLHVVQCKCAPTLSCFIKYSCLAKMRYPDGMWPVVA
jgi:hypothetical protein